MPHKHWIFQELGEPPAPLRMGTDNSLREPLTTVIREAAKYAIRGATMSGMLDDFDADALVRNMIVGMLGYHTKDGFSHMNDEAVAEKGGA